MDEQCQRIVDDQRNGWREEGWAGSNPRVGKLGQARIILAGPISYPRPSTSALFDNQPTSAS